jgi:hypothetical protein
MLSVVIMNVVAPVMHYKRDKHPSLFIWIFKCKENERFYKIFCRVVMKSIRIKFSDLDPWIGGSGIKLIHLVRDPRAVYRSMLERLDQGLVMIDVS